MDHQEGSSGIDKDQGAILGGIWCSCMGLPIWGNFRKACQLLCVALRFYHAMFVVKLDKVQNGKNVEKSSNGRTGGMPPT